MRTHSLFTSPAIATAGVAAGACLLAACATTNSDPRLTGATIHERALTLDTHIDVPLNYATVEQDPGGFTTLQNDLPKMRAGALDGAFFIVYTPQGPLTDEGYAEARRIAETRYAGISRMMAAYSNEIGFARTADEVEAIHASGRLVALIGMENAFPIGPSLDDLPMWAERGVRYVSATHFGHNQFGDSSNPNLEGGDPEVKAGGLTPLGEDLIRGLNRHGIMVDVSHTGKATTLEAIALSRAPVIASHSGANAVHDNARNLDDEQLRAIAENGGVVQVVAFDTYLLAPTPARILAEERVNQRFGVASRNDLAEFSDERVAEYRAAIAAARRSVDPADLDALMDHVDHVVAVAGIDHVGIASDFDGGGGLAGWRDTSQTAAVTDAMIARGYSEADIAKIWGGNLLRVMRAVEAVAAEIAAENEA